MRNLKIVGVGLCVALLACFAVIPAVAQEEETEEGNIVQVIFVEAKDGQEEEFEAGVKEHVEFHRQHNDPWAWNAWTVISGDNMGHYGFGIFGRRWADFDNPPIPHDADEADIEANIAPYTERVAVRYYARLADVSRPRPEGDPAPMAVVLTINVRMGAQDKFMHAIEKVNDAIKKTNWDAYYNWYALVNGGEHPTFVLVLPQESWADMAPPEKSFEAMLKEGLGDTEAEMVEHIFDHVIKSESSVIIRSRPELSYSPEEM